MLKKTKEGFLILGNLSRCLKITHGFSTKTMGNMMGFDLSDMISMEQVHKNRVSVVGKNEKGKMVKGADGIVSREKGVILGVRAADCLPVLFYDPKQEIVGMAHAGWQGIVGGIVSVTVKKMRSLGSRPADILVGIGPHIGGCCYTVERPRIQIFQEKFGDLPGMIYKDTEGIHLDLAVPAVFQLEKMGVKRENIEVSLACTSCQNQDFFSFRKEKTEKRILGVIGLI